MLKNLTVHGIGVGHRRALEDVVTAIDRTGIKPVIDRRYPLTELPASVDHLDLGAFAQDRCRVGVRPTITELQNRVVLVTARRKGLGPASRG